METQEADSRFGATALRALDDALSLAAREPRVALTQARKAVEAVALHLYARDVGDPDAASKRLMLDDLLKALWKQKVIPEGVGMHFGTVQRYGNYGTHPQADDASVGNTVAFNQPCIESLRFIARWYVKDKLRLPETDVPQNLRALVRSASVVPQEPAPAATGPKGITSPAAPSEEDPFGLVGARLDDKYQIDSMVAEGGFGAVYRGVHLTLEKPIALKVLKAPAGAIEAERQTFIESFTLEAKTIARMEHPSIVRVLDFGVSVMPTGAPSPWMVLDWLAGESLDVDLRRRRGQPGRSPAEALALLRPVLEAVAYAHSEGIAHRDIKPANIMLPAAPSPRMSAVPAEPEGSPTTRPRTAAGSTGRRGDQGAKLLDFGIAKIMRSDETEASGHTQTQSSMVAFSLPYAAPEQLSNTRTGPWTDVHALALVIVELLVNRAPYEADDAQGLYTAVLSPDRPTPARLGLDAGSWEPVLARALAARPASRFASAGDLLEALEADVPAAVKPLADMTPQARTAPTTPAPPTLVGETFRGAQVPTRRSPSSRRAVYVTVGAAVLALVAAEAVFALGASEEPSPESRGTAQQPEPDPQPAPLVRDATDAGLAHDADVPEGG